ncbi:MAG: hypothetical protein ACI379_03000 [Nocardioides sp.]|uniref:hypothetical protein n=1 Tax=Nocardioides sp. TaxID=35761 RepID=UPI003F01FD27
MDTLEDRLRTLGTPGPAVAVPPGEELWQRGRRWSRRRRLGSAATVLCVLAMVAGLGVWSWDRSRPAEVLPADDQAEVFLPQQIHRMSGWLDELPPGRVVAVNAGIERQGIFGSRPGVAAISATTGAYGFIDVPEHSTGYALSPDGRRLAYWVPGETRKEPRRLDGPPSEASRCASWRQAASSSCRSSPTTGCGAAT